MPAREALNLSGGMRIETGRDWNGRFWIAYRKGCSMFFRDPSQLRRWLSLAPKTASREAFDSWIASLEAADAERTQPATSAGTVQHAAPSLSQEAIATGFGPECHLDESDPQFQTRAIT